MVPLSGASSPLIRRNSVVLPEPLGPTRPTRVFAWRNAVACANTTCGPKVFEIASIWIITPPLYGVAHTLRNLPTLFEWAVLVFHRRVDGKSISLKRQAAFASAQKGAYIGTYVLAGG